MSETSTPLRDLTVIDLSHHAGGSYGPMLLARFGATVIKVERPGTGDALREIGPLAAPDAVDGRGGSFISYNAGKLGITLDWKEPRGHDVLLGLLRKADILWENYTPGTLARAGLDYESVREVNPRLIYASMTGYGHYGVESSQYAGRPMLDIVAQALGGVMDITGQPGGPPTAVGAIIGDLVPALFLANGVLAALHRRSETGLGIHVDVSMVDAVIGLTDKSIVPYGVAGKRLVRGREDRMAPWGVFKAQDGYVVIACPVQSIWERLTEVINRPDLASNPDLQTGQDRARNNEACIRPAIEEWLAARPAASGAEVLSLAGVPAGTVQSAEDVWNWDYVKAREMLTTVDDPVLGEVKITGNVAKFGGIDQPKLRHAPLLGEHTDAVLSELVGLGAEEIAALRADGVI